MAAVDFTETRQEATQIVQMRENKLYMETNKTWKRNQNNSNKKSIGLLGKEEEGSVKYKGRKKCISTVTHPKGSEWVDSYSSELLSTT